MTDAHLAPLTAADRAVLERWLIDFDRAWAPALLAERVAGLPLPGSPLRLAALAEFAKIDLERRWRAGIERPAAEYIALFPELASAADALARAEEDVRRSFASASRQTSRSGDRLTPPPDTVAVPARVGKFRVERELGRGGMGAVYLAHDEQLDRKVALKVPTRGSAELTERFLREARAAATLQHPNICPVFEVNTADGVCYLAMAYVEGRPLSDFTRGDRLPSPAAAARVVAKVARALAVAHRAGVVHRDLKPSNVMVRPDREPVVMDFGLARRLGGGAEKLTREGAVLGTPAYMPPEQVNGQEAGPAADVYSLGVVLYELLTGTVPFQGINLMQVFGQVLMTDPDPPSARRPGIDPALDAVCLRALRKKPEDRFASMDDMAAALEECARSARGGSATELVPPPEEPPPPAPRRRTVGVWALAALAGLGLLAAGGLLLRVKTPGGVIVLDGVPTDAEVVVDGERVTVTRDRESVTVSVAPGREHELKVERGGVPVWSKRVTVELSGSPLRLHVEPAVADPAPPPAVADPDTPAGNHAGVITGHRHKVVALRFTPDGARLASAGNGDTHEIKGNVRYHVPGPDNGVRVWDVATGREVRHFPMTEGHKYGPVALAVSPDGRRLACASSWWTANGHAEARVYVWDVATGVREQHLTPANAPPVRDEWAGLRDVAFAADGQRVAAVRSGKGGVCWWSLPGGTALPGVRLEDAGLAEAPALRFSADARFVYGGVFTGKGEFRAWDAATGRAVTTFTGHAGIPLRVIPSPDGKRVLSSGPDFTVRLWDAATGKELWRVGNLDSRVGCLAFTPDGRRFLAGADDGLVTLRDADTGREVARFPGHGKKVWDVAVAPSGRLASSGDDGGTVRLWRLPAAGGPPAAAAKPAAGGFAPLFNATDLTGWDVHNSRTITWRNDNGTVTGANNANRVNTGGAIFTAKEYGDFHLRGEVRAGTGSPITFRNNLNPGPGAERGYLIPNQPASDAAWEPGCLCADLFQREPQKLAAAAGPRPRFGPDDWYALEVVARGPHVEVFVNGRRTVDYTAPADRHARHPKGAIGFHCQRGSRVGFRNVEVKELPPDLALQGRTPAQ